MRKIGLLPLVFRRPVGTQKDFRLRCCKSWRCPKCRRMLAYKYARILQSMLEYNDGFSQVNKAGREVCVMWTLGTNYFFNERGLKMFAKAWDNFRKHLAKLNIDKYIGVLEAGEKGGRVHLHCIFKTFDGKPVEHERILSVWRGCTKQKANVNFKAVKVDDNWHLANYMIKYMSKGLVNGCPFRRFRSSKGLERFYEPVEFEYAIVGTHPVGVSPLNYLISNIDSVVVDGWQIVPQVDKSGEIADFVLREDLLGT